MTQLRRCNIPTPFETPCAPHTHHQPLPTSIWTLFGIFSHLYNFPFLPSSLHFFALSLPRFLFFFIPLPSLLPPPLQKKKGFTMPIPVFQSLETVSRGCGIRQEPGWAGKRKGGEVLCFCHRRGVVDCTAVGEEEAHSWLKPLLAVWP